MVRYKDIIKVIEEYTEKCRTIAEIRTMVNRLSKSERFEQLKEKGLLNEYEIDHYESIVDMKRWYAEQGFQKAPELIAHCNELLFDYDKRLFNYYKPRKPQYTPYNEDDYSMEKKTEWNDPFIREVEQRQIDSQEDIIWTDDEKSAVRHYLNTGYVYLNSKINNGKQWNELSDDEKKAKIPKLNKMDRDLQSAINKSKGLVEPTVMFHGGYFDVHKIVGDTIKFKGYTSASYQESVASNYKNNKSNDLMGSCMYKILLPKGYKGLCGNARYFTENNDESKSNYLTVYQKEHEYLLPKNAEFKIVDIEQYSTGVISGSKFTRVTLMPV